PLSADPDAEPTLQLGVRRNDAVGVRELAAVVVARGDADTRHAQAARSGYIGAAQIADVQRPLGRDAECIERRAERARVWLRKADLVREDLHVEVAEQPVAPQAVAHDG